MGGWTIMELMVVIAIFGIAMAAATISIKSLTRADLRSAAFRTAGAARYVFDRATMTGMYMRLVIHIDKGEIWIEESSDLISLRPGRAQNVADEYGETAAERRERLSRRTEDDVAFEKHTKEMEQRERDAEEMAKGGGLGSLFGFGGSGAAEEESASTDYSDDSSALQPGIDQDLLIFQWERDMRQVERPRASFKPLKNMVSRKIKLAKGVRIAGVTTPRHTEPVQNEYAFVYFFPQGHSEAAIIHLTDGADGDEDDAKYFSVVLHPLTGQAKVYGCYYEIPDDFGASDDKRGKFAKDRCAKEGAL